MDEAEIKPYFQLDKMVEAAFETARRLFGLTFTPVDVPLYHPDARAFEVKDAARPSLSACSSATISRAPPSTPAPG